MICGNPSVGLQLNRNKAVLDWSFRRIGGQQTGYMVGSGDIRRDRMHGESICDADGLVKYFFPCPVL
jgi:hypothetical protein